MDELIYASATSLAQAIRDKRVSSQEVVEDYIHHIEAVNPQLNAVAHWNPGRGETLAVAQHLETVLGGWQRPDL